MIRRRRGPVDGLAQGLVAGQSVAGSAGEESETLVETCARVGEAHRPGPRCDELECEGDFDRAFGVNERARSPEPSLAACSRP